MTGVAEAPTSQTEATNAASGSRSTSDSLSSTAFKEEFQNVYNEVQGTELFDKYDDSESSDPEDIQTTISRESPSPCSKGRKRCSAKQRKSRSRHKKRFVSRMVEPCHEPSSPPYVRPLITAVMPTVPTSSPSEQWLLHYKRLKKAKFKCTLLLGHNDTVHSVAVDQNLVLSASGDTTVKVWSTQAGRELCSLRGHTGTVNAVLLLSSEQTEVLCGRMGRASTYRLAVSGSSDACLNIWLALEGKLLKSMYTYNAITALAVITDDCHIVVGTEGGKLEVWDVAKGSPLSSVIGHDGVIESIRADWTDTVFSASSDGSLKVWQWLSNELCAVQVYDADAAESCHMHCVAVDGSKIFVGRDSACVKVIDWATGRVDYLKNHPHDHGLAKAVFVKDSLLLSTSYDRYTGNSTVNMRTLPGGAYVGTLKCTGQGKVSALACDIVERKILRIVTGGTTLAVWDWAPHENNGECPVLFLETLAEYTQRDGNESNKSSDSPERQLQLYQGNTQAGDTSWCNIM
ncbi:transducin beta-like protein 3 isoform X2 [Dermacentor variabilis]|uniref:transducin beta-like protein 3 isoform X2 n=1 Tax=Dermacentor variabilis TaxID=34621 RepID=UPI003F5B1200